MKRLQMILGAIFGAMAMFFLDPQRGNRRRALLRDQMMSMATKTEDVVEGRAEDVKNRAQEMVAEAKYRLKEEPLSDQVLTELVKSEMGRVITRAADIDVSVREGKVTLRGPIPAKEIDKLLEAAEALPGVKEIENRLEIQETNMQGRVTGTASSE